MEGHQWVHDKRLSPDAWGSYFNFALQNSGVALGLFFRNLFVSRYVTADAHRLFRARHTRSPSPGAPSFSQLDLPISRTLAFIIIPPMASSFFPSRPSRFPSFRFSSTFLPFP